MSETQIHHHAYEDPEEGLRIVADATDVEAAAAAAHSAAGSPEGSLEADIADFPAVAKQIASLQRFKNRLKRMFDFNIGEGRDEGWRIPSNVDIRTYQESVNDQAN